jgi:signal transduction histidine kinase
VFWVFFAAYAGSVVVWLFVGIAPALVHEVGSLHRALHEQAGGDLRAGDEVTIHFQNDRPREINNVVLASRGRTVFNGPAVAGTGRAEYTFVAPLAGSYRMVSTPHPKTSGELRFTDDAPRSLTVRVPEAGNRFEKVEPSGWNAVAGRVADASHHADHGGRVTVETLFSVLNLGLGVLLVVRRPGDRTARLLAIGMIGTAVTFNHQSHSMIRAEVLGDWSTPHLAFHLASGLAYMYAVIVFPDGRLVPTRSRRARWPLWLLYAVATYFLAMVVLNQSALAHPGQTFFAVLFALLIPLVGVAAQTYRLRHAEDPVRRQQSRLLRWALLPTFVAGLVWLSLAAIYGSDRLEGAGPAIFPAFFALIPIALVMGILRYRLWDIDVLVSKTLLSVGLAAFIGAVYVGVVVLLGHLIGSTGGSAAGLKIAATAIAAVAFEPVRGRLQRFANRMVYGERATPYEVMADFTTRLASVISVEQVLPRLAEATARGVGALAGRVTAYLPGGGTRTVLWPPLDVTTPYSRVVEVRYRGQPVGEIAVLKAAGERLRPDEEVVLNAMAGQAGLAFNNARLAIELEARLQEISAQADELRASRQRIVTARQGQRQRVVQIIHDQVELRLEAARLAVDGIERLLPDGADEAADWVERLLLECGEALDSLRTLARGIFPAVLADQGLVPALQTHAVQAGLPVTVDIEADEACGRFDADAEANVYFCVVQALANAGAYAPASNVVVRLRAANGRLEFSVADDGPGAEQRTLSEGADIRDMRDRLEAIGGALEVVSFLGQGTAVSGWVPDERAASPEAVSASVGGSAPLS